MRFNELKGLDGIDKLLECAEYIDEIFGDTDIFTADANKKTYGELAIPIYKKHTEAVNKIFEILQVNPENSAEIIVETINIIDELLSNEDVIRFFTAASKNLKSCLSAMLSTEGEQSKDS
jgi:hypothetical protein